jgi:lipopolysaccharide transport system ATP-binding protein
VRLAFAVAAHVDADILLIDEVLAVGDAEFQKRCLGMMGDVARAGRTVIFVSHNLTALRNLCGTGLLMDKGQISELGLLPRVLEGYAGKSLSTSEVTFTPDAAEPQECHVTRVAVIPAGGATGGIYGTRGMSVQVDVQVIQEDRIDVFLHCYNDSQVMVFSSGSFFDASVGDLPVTRGEYRFFCDIPGRLLNDGTYTLDVMLVRDRQHVLSQTSSVISFAVLDDFELAQGWHWRPAGTVRPQIAWRREHHE